MLLLKFEEGGRPSANDDLETLQREVYSAMYAPFYGLPNCVVSGCEVTINNGQADISHGLVWLSGEVLRFDGAAGLVLPVELYALATADSDPRPYQVGGTKYCMTERVVAVRALDAATISTPKVVVRPEGVLRLAKAREASTRLAGETKWLAKLNAADFDANGRGKYGTLANGWQFNNGKGGASNGAGKFPVAAAASQFAVGTTGGAAAVTLGMNNLPPHSHGMDNAGDHTHGTNVNGFRDSPTFGLPANTIQYSHPGSTKFGDLTISNAGSHIHNIQNAGGNSQGGADPVEILPPWFSYAVVEWVGLTDGLA